MRTTTSRTQYAAKIRWSRTVVALVLIGGLSVLSPQGALADAGDLDTSFGTNGSGEVDFGGPNVDTASTVDTQDRIVVAGTSFDLPNNTNSRIGIARLLPDGNPDATFGTGGQVILDFSPTNDDATALVALPDGSVLGAGSTQTPSGRDVLLFKLDASGNLDAAFGGGTGFTITDFGGSEASLAIAVDANQKILVGGPSFLARFETNGSVDGTFGVGGEAGLGGAINIRGIHLMQNGMILLGGEVQGQLGAARLSSSGVLDPSYGTNGLAMSAFSGSTSGDASAVQADGKMVISGNNRQNPFNINFAVARFDTSGLLDTTFAGTGMTTTDFGVGDFGTGLAIQADGRILVGGTIATTFTGSADIGIARYLPNGTLDPDFATSGQLLVNLGRFEFARKLRLQSDGLILSTGHTASSVGRQDADLQVVRFFATDDEEPPVVSNLTADPAPAPTGVAIAVAAVADDSQTGGSAIASSIYQIDGEAPIPLAAADGSFDEPTETLTGVIPPFDQPGVYELCVLATDAAGNTSPPSCTFIPVYDPSAGFVTGGGWFDSPGGAYAVAPDHTGRATFGFVSKYKKGTQVPTGNTHFQLHIGGFTFQSTSYDWLVVTGQPSATFKGTGTVDGQGAYKFRVWATDDETDTFRIKIWTEDVNGQETVIYDNGPGQAIQGGSIIIHSA